MSAPSPAARPVPTTSPPATSCNPDGVAAVHRVVASISEDIYIAPGEADRVLREKPCKMAFTLQHGACGCGRCALQLLLAVFGVLPVPSIGSTNVEPDSRLSKISRLPEYPIAAVGVKVT